MRFFSVFSGLLILAILPIGLSAQSWVDKMQDENVNFYEVQNEFNTWWQGKTVEKGKGYKQYKRWEWFMEPRVYPSGNRLEPDKALKEYEYWKQITPQQKSPNGNWVSIGPNGVPSGGGAGRVNCVRFDPSDPTIIYAGTPAGGVWKTTNNGTSWILLNTDNLASIGISDIAIDPANSNIIYIATGDGDGADTHSIGVLKSTDGGVTWNSTGLNWQTSQTRTIRRLLIHPNNPQILIAGTSNGIYRTTNGGTTWTQTTGSSSRDMEFHPTNPNIIYSASSTFRKSTDNGQSWTLVSLPQSGIGRIAIAVTPANTSYVYLLASDNSDNGFGALMRSTDEGNSFTVRSTSPNIMGWSTSGNDSGGQGWYDIAIAASPTNAEEIYAGGVNIWRSQNGGTSWSLKAHWYGGGGVSYVHADIHDLIYAPGSGSTIYSGNDGGVFQTSNNGSSWSDRSGNLTIAQMYKLGVSQTDAGKVISGWQDNGTNLKNGVNWSEVLGGDGMECIISHSNANTMYGSLYYGDISKSTNGGASWSGIVNSGGTGVDADGNWVTPYIMSPLNSNFLLVGKGQVYKSTNAGSSWTQLGNVTGGSGNVSEMAFAPSDDNYIYVSKQTKLFVSTNGSTFTDRTAGLPVSSAAITYIAVSNTDPKKAWVTFSGFSSANKVYYTANAGQSWTNYTTGLPNIPANCIVYQNGSNDAVYVGMDVGVYYRDASMNSWQAFNYGLPNTIVSELEIQYTTQKLRAATYGRGMWESDLYSQPNSPPVAAFMANTTTVCVGEAVQFTDISINQPDSWYWSFGNGDTSILQNPSVIYTQPGSYDITLIASNSFGNDTVIQTAYITVITSPTNNLISQDQSVCYGSNPATFSGSLPGGGNGAYTYQWQRSTGGANGNYINLPGITTQDYTYSNVITQNMWFRRLVTSGQCQDTSNVIMITALSNPPTPVVSVNGNTLSTSGGVSYQWSLAGTDIQDATDSFIVAIQEGNYTVTLYDSNGCFSTSAPVFVASTEDVLNSSVVHVYPNPSNGDFDIIFNDNISSDAYIKLTNILGQTVYEEMIKNTGKVNLINISQKNIETGVYFLQVSYSGKKLFSKIVINR